MFRTRIRSTHSSHTRPAFHNALVVIGFAAVARVAARARPGCV